LLVIWGFCYPFASFYGCKGSQKVRIDKEIRSFCLMKNEKNCHIVTKWVFFDAK
jgi:hypothetical protein